MGSDSALQTKDHQANQVWVPQKKEGTLQGDLSTIVMTKQLKYYGIAYVLWFIGALKSTSMIDHERLGMGKMPRYENFQTYHCRFSQVAHLHGHMQMYNTFATIW